MLSLNTRSEEKYRSILKDGEGRTFSWKKELKPENKLKLLSCSAVVNIYSYLQQILQRDSILSTGSLFALGSLISDNATKQFQSVNICSILNSRF